MGITTVLKKAGRPSDKDPPCFIAQGHSEAEALSKKQVIGWDITIYNPDLDPGERSADKIVDYIVAGATARSRA